MKKKLLIIILCFSIIGIFFILFSKPAVNYTQQNLKKPARIELVIGSTPIFTYENGSEDYNKIFDIITRNWWKYSDTADEITDASSLKEVAHLKEIKTTTNERYFTGTEHIIRFIYEDQPLLWTNQNGNTLEIKTLAFLLPCETNVVDEANPDTCIKGIFTLAKTEELGINEGIFTYYYSNNIINIWNVSIYER